MYNPRQKKPKITILGRKDITDYVRSFVLHMRKTEGRVLTARHRDETEYMKSLMNDPKNTTYKSFPDFRDGDYFWHHQRVDFVTSNLGKGFVFYFICNSCRQRAKYLYEYSPLQSPLCRVCCRLPYPVSSRQARYMSRLLRKPYLSSEDKQALVRRAGIRIEDVVAALASG